MFNSQKIFSFIVIINVVKKFILSFGVIGFYALYAFHLKNEQSNHQIIAPQSLQNPTPTSIPTPTPQAPNNFLKNIIPSSTPTPTPSTSGAYKDGSYVGSVANAFYGNIQVKAVISGGKITDVVFLQYPNDRGTSIMINSQADPYLTQEAIQIQSANVDIVSGATDSSIAFRESLSSALSQAK